MLRIDSIGVDNLRGYSSTSLPLNKLTILVGENNEGKSSLLKMLERLMHTTSEFWSGNRTLTDSDFEFWYPANDARHKARRFTIAVELLDGRIGRRFGVKKGDVVDLRFAVSSTGEFRLNLGKPKRAESHDSKALELLELLQSNVSLVFLPPIRDAHSSVFAEKLTRSVKEKLSEKLTHSKQAGAPREYRLAKEVIAKIQDIVAIHSGELSASPDSPLSSMLRASEVRVDLFPRHVFELIDRSMFVYLSTGDHDKLKVLPREVGNGLQSLIDISLTLESILKSPDRKRAIVVVEEPEAFLHPSAQRQFMQFLRRALVDKVESAVLTTHSPIIVDEAAYEEVVLVRNHKHFIPTDTGRASINTSLMTTGSSEVFFARTIVLLEGEGDRAFFNTLLRRIKRQARVCPELSGLVLQVTGGSTYYSPWLKLVRSYRTLGADPFSCVWLMDGDVATDSDGHRPVLRVARDCDFGLQQAQVNTITEFGDLAWQGDVRDPARVAGVNNLLAQFGGHLFCCDLEWALVNNTSTAVIQRIRSALTEAGIGQENLPDELAIARKLGSKIGTGRASDGAKKAPYIRAMIAEKIDLSALPPEIFSVLSRILSVCFKNDGAVRDLLRECGIGEGARA